MISALIVSLVLMPQAWSMPRPDKVHATLSRKSEAYIHDGVFVGGDRAVDGVTVRDIRRAANLNFDRLVIDLEGNRQGEIPTIQRPPYYQVAVSQDEDRMMITVWGKPKLQFNAPKVVAGLRKSTILGPVQLLPKLDDDSWTFVIGLKGGRAVEVFELTNPVRIIVDIKAGVKTAIKSGTSKND